MMAHLLPVADHWPAAIDIVTGGEVLLQNGRALQRHGYNQSQEAHMRERRARARKEEKILGKEKERGGKWFGKSTQTSSEIIIEIVTQFNAGRLQRNTFSV
jgi:hypothetical protein